MAIRLRLVTALVRRDAVEADYAGGAEAFRRDYPQAEEDAGLFGLHAMSGGEIEQLLARIALQRGCASSAPVPSETCGLARSAHARASPSMPWTVADAFEAGLPGSRTEMGRCQAMGRGRIYRAGLDSRLIGWVDCFSSASEVDQRVCAGDHSGSMSLAPLNRISRLSMII